MRNKTFLSMCLSLALCLGFIGCAEEYDDTEIWQKVNELVERVQKLEAICNEQNSNIAAIQKLLSEQGTGTYITSVTELPNGAGYTIKFSDNTEINIYNGTNSDDAPQISVVKQGDDYYWTINGEILKDADGNPVKANGEKGEKGDQGEAGQDGKDGADGEAGADGKDGVTPILKTGAQLIAEGVAGEWEKTAIYITIDGENWIRISANNPITYIENKITVEEGDTTVIITLTDGSILTFPKSNQIMELLCGVWESVDYTDEWRVLIGFSKDGTWFLNSNEFDLVGSTTIEKVKNGRFNLYSNTYSYSLCTETIYTQNFGLSESEIWVIHYISEDTLLIKSDYLFEAAKFVRIDDDLSTKKKGLEATGTANNHEYVDMGDAGKWSTCNLGATNPYDIGTYHEMRKAAGNLNWGTGWRVPLKQDFELLLKHCYIEWLPINGTYGLLATAKNGNQIFLPAAGGRRSDGGYVWEATEVQEAGLYWTSDTYDPYRDYTDAEYFRFEYDGSCYFYEEFNRYNLSIRPVYAN